MPVPTVTDACGNRAPAILCVDRDEDVLDGIALQLRQLGECVGAHSAAAALRLLEERDDIGVILSEVRLPRVDGVEFLLRAGELAPHAIQILLTGYAGVDVAVRAVNTGRVFRFLTKPCPKDQLLAAVASAIEQHRLVTMRDQVLDETLPQTLRLFLRLVAGESETARRMLAAGGEVARDAHGAGTGSAVLAAMLRAASAAPDAVRQELRQIPWLDEAGRLIAGDPRDGDRP